MGKNIFITGGSSGIGLALTELYLKRGDRVGVLGRNKQKWQDCSVSQNLKATFYSAAIEEKDQVKRAMQEFTKSFGPIDIVIASAGIGNSNKSAIPDFEKSEQIIKINVLGTLYTIEAAFELMYPHKKGQIVLISSVAGYVGLAGNGAYCASKSAVQRLAETYAIDFSSFGINVLCVSPGFVKTPLTEKNTHSMPFIISAERASEVIAEAIEKKSSWIGFPWQLYYFMGFLSVIPSSLYIWLSKKFKINLYKKH